MAPYVDKVFSSPGEHSGAGLTLGLAMFALQIYGDFAGYSDIARGVSRTFGIELMENFGVIELTRTGKVALPRT